MLVDHFHKNEMTKVPFFNMANMIQAYSETDKNLSTMVSFLCDKYNNLDQSLNAPKTILLLDTLTKDENKCPIISPLVQAMGHYIG
jgi:hypothetical protein